MLLNNLNSLSLNKFTFKKYIMNKIESLCQRIGKTPNVKKQLVIENDDLKLLSRYEMQSIELLGKVFGKVTKNPNHVSLKELLEIFNAVTRHKTDPEKLYLIALYFPEKIDKVYHINPFPIPSYTYKQSVTLRFNPNALGNFAMQIICPYFLDETVPNTVSNVYVCTDAALNGTTIVSTQSATQGTGWTAQVGTRVNSTWYLN